MTDSDKLGLGLDDIIRRDRTTGNRRGGGGTRGFRARGAGAGRSTNNFNGFRTRGGGGIPRTSNPPVGRWKHDLFDNDASVTRPGQRTGGVNSTTKLLVSNLDYGVTTNDVHELFEDIGAVRSAHVFYDETGRSLGTAEVVFERRADAVTAQKKYHNLNLDGRPMDIKVVGAEQQQTVRSSFNNNAGGGGGGGFRNTSNRGGATRGRGAGTGRGQQNGQKSNGKAEAVSAEDLDADLEAYRAESGAKK